MHSALISSSAHQLAAQHLSRLKSFPSTDLTSPTISKAQQRVADAESELHGQMTAMRESFTRLMQSVVSRDGDRPVDVSGLQLDGVKDRLKRLEDRVMPVSATSVSYQPRPSLPSSPPPSGLRPPGPHGHPSSDHVPTSEPPKPPEADNGGSDSLLPAKRLRVKGLLSEVLDRMDKVEEMVHASQGKQEDLENLIWEQVEEFRMTRPASWSRLEAKRDPNASKKRKRDQAQGDGLETEEEQTTDITGGEADWSAWEARRGPDAQEDVTMGEDQVKDESATVAALRDQVALLREQLDALKADKEESDRNVITASIQGMRAEYTAIVRQVNLCDRVSDQRLRTRIGIPKSRCDVSSTAESINPNKGIRGTSLSDHLVNGPYHSSSKHFFPCHTRRSHTIIASLERGTPYTPYCQQA